MKKALFTLLLVFSAFAVFSQSFPPVTGIPLTTGEDYHAAENVVLDVSNTLLTTPADQNYEWRLKASQFIFRWLAGTPDFNFTFGQNVLKYIDNDIEPESIYFAALASYALQNKSVKDSNTVILNAVEKLVAYINISSNHVTITRQLKKLADAAGKGQLKSFLKL
jgi:hypothetical protein